MQQVTCGAANRPFDSLRQTLRDFTYECRAVTVRLMAYIGGLAALAMLAADLLSGATVPDPAAEAAAPAEQWQAASRPQPAFAAPIGNFSGKTASYGILRNSDGGRRDILAWADSDQAAPFAWLEVQRAGEGPDFGPSLLEIAKQALAAGGRNVQAAGLIDSKFGPVTLASFRRAADGLPQSCMGFARGFADVHVQITGWTCAGDGPREQRQTLSCMLNRLTMLSAGNDARFAELFAHAELRRTECGTMAAADWLGSLDEPRLRGALAVARR